jgi:ring-1,2-phenylacetyl-CoA epoxidase subunit PaaC
VTAATYDYVLRLADTHLVLAQRLGEWVGHAPAIEEDLGLANIALDALGQARLLLSYAGELEGRGRDEDALAFFRMESEFRNAQLAEQPNGDFGQTIVRQYLLDAWRVQMFERLAQSADQRLAQIAAKAIKEARYHLRYSAGWLVRLGDGTSESQQRVQTALDALWPYTRELLEPDELDERMLAQGVGPDLGDVALAWRKEVEARLATATLVRPCDRSYGWHGKRGQHSEHLGRMLAEMQSLPRSFAGASW